MYCENYNQTVCNDHPRIPKFVAVVDRWSFFRGRFMLCYKDLNWDTKIVVAVGRWSLAQVWLYIQIFFIWMLNNLTAFLITEKNEDLDLLDIFVKIFIQIFDDNYLLLCPLIICIAIVHVMMTIIRR
jgi:hypothetical protein